MDWFKRLVSKDPPSSSKQDSPSSSDTSTTTPSTSSAPLPKPAPPTKEELKRLAEAQKAKEKELFAQLNLAWKQSEDCNPKDRPAKHASLMRAFLTLYDEHKISFKNIKTGFPGLTSGFQTAVCSFVKDGYQNIMNHGTPSTSPKKRRAKDKMEKSASSTSQTDQAQAFALRLYTFLDKEAYDTLRVLLILSQELLEINPLVAADMPTTLVNIYLRFWQLPSGVILTQNERLAKASSSTPTGTNVSSASSAPSPSRPSPEELLISVLLQLCSSKTSIVKLMESDAFTKLFLMPLMHSDAIQSLSDRILPVTSTVIKYNVDAAVIDYLLKKDCISSIVEMMANNFENFAPSAILDACTMVLSLLEESVKVNSDLIEEFNNMQGYNLLTKAVIVLEDKAPGSDYHVRLVEYIKDFVFVGTEPLYPEHDDENKYNPPPLKRDPLTGKVLEDPGAALLVSEDGTKLRRARNAEAFQVMQNCFFGAKHDKTKELILDCMVSLFSAHPGNFYALQHLRTLAHFVEALPQESPAVRDGIHQLVLCCATYINVIPYFALVSLWNVFLDAVPKANMSVLEGVFNTFLVLLNYDSRYRTILADAGVLQGLIEVLQRYHKAVAKMLMSSSKLASKTGGSGAGVGLASSASGRKKADSASLKRITQPKTSGSVPLDLPSPALTAPKRFASGSGPVSLRKYGARGALARLKAERLREQTRVCEELLADKSIESLDINAAYPAVTDLLSLMVTECPENASVLKKANGSQALHNLMQQTETRSGALTILVQLIRHDDSQTEGDMGNLLITLSSHSDIEMRRDILLSLLDLFKSTPATKRSFREFGGFASVFTTVVLLRARLDNNTMTNDASGYSYYLDTLKLVLSVITSAVASHRVNRLHMAAHGGWPLLETTVRDTGLWDSNPELYIDWMFLLATENMSYVQTIPSSASTYAKSKLAKDAATLMSDNKAHVEAQEKALKKRTSRYQHAVNSFVDFYASQNLTGPSGEVVAEPRDLLSILLALDAGEHTDHQPVDHRSTWMNILPVDDSLPIIFNPGSLSSLLNLVLPVPISYPKPKFADEEEDEEAPSSGNNDQEKNTESDPSSDVSSSSSSSTSSSNEDEDEDSTKSQRKKKTMTKKKTTKKTSFYTLPISPARPSSTPASASKTSTSKFATVSPQEVTWHLHVLLRLIDFARGNAANLEALGSLGLAGKIMRRWSSHLKNLGSPLHAPLLYLVELIMAYRPDTLEVTQYLGLFEPSRTSNRALQACLQSLLRTASCGQARLAPFFLFDLSRSGFGSMSSTISDLQWPFSEGYTVSMWCYFDRFSPEDIELFRLAPSVNTSFHPPFPEGVSSSHSGSGSPAAANVIPTPSTCIVSAVLRTGQLILRNAGAEEPLTVETFNFATGRWYHIAIVHERFKFQFSNNGETKVYVDGVLRASIRANMGAPTNNSTLSLTLGTPESIHQQKGPDSAFGHGVSAAWRLGPFALLDQSIPNVDVLTLFSLGPAYYASFQGSLAGHYSPEVINSQYLLALEEIRGEPISEADESKQALQTSFGVERVVVSINAVKHVLQMHPSSRNLPNFAFMRDPSGKRGIAPLFSTTSDAIRSQSTVVSANAGMGPNSTNISGTGGSSNAGNATSNSGSSSSTSSAGGLKDTSSSKSGSEDQPGSNSTAPGFGKLSDSQKAGSKKPPQKSKMDAAGVLNEEDEDVEAEVNTTALTNAAGVLAGLGSPIEVGGKTADNTSKAPLTLQFENGDSPIACWPQPIQTVLYRTNGMDMLAYLFEYVASCEASIVPNVYLPPQSAGSTTASAAQNVPSSPLGTSSFASLPSESDDSQLHTPPTSARQSSQLGSATPSTPQLPPDISMALLVLRCIRAIVRSNPQAYLDFSEKSGYIVIAQVLKRFPVQLTEEKMKIFLDLVGVVPNGFTSLASSVAQEEALSHFLTSFDSSVLNTLPKPISESLWSLALHQIPSGSLSTATLSNVIAFKNFFMDYRMWKKAPLRLQELVIDYMDHLIQGNLLFQFNVSRMRKAHLLPHLMNVLREEALDMTLFIRVLGLVSDLLVAHHTEKDLNIVAGFLIHSFHLQNNPTGPSGGGAGSNLPPTSTSASNPTVSHAAPVNDGIDMNTRLEQLATRFDMLRNMLLGIIFYLVADAENKSFYERVFDPDWLGLFITQEANPDTVTTAFKIMAQLYSGSSSYSIRVERTNILKHFSNAFTAFHSHVPLYYYLFGMTFGKPPTDLPERINQLDFAALLEVFKLPHAEDEYPIICKGALEIIFAMIKASSEAYILENDAYLPQSPSSLSGPHNLLDSDAGDFNVGIIVQESPRSGSSGGTLEAISDDGESPRSSLDSFSKSASSSNVVSSSSPTTPVMPRIGALTAATRRSVGGDAGGGGPTDLSRRRAVSLALPRPNLTSSSASVVSSAAGSGNSSARDSGSYAGGVDDTMVGEPSDGNEDVVGAGSNAGSAGNPNASTGMMATATSGLSTLVNRGIAATVVGGSLLGVFKGSKSSKRKSTIVNQYVPQQVIGGTMSGASVTSRVYPKFQDKFSLFCPAVYYQEQSRNLIANFSPHRSLLQFIKHVLSRSSAMQDLFRKGDLAHLILSILFPKDKLNLPKSGAVWSSPMNSNTASSPGNAATATGSASSNTSSTATPTIQSGADQWSLLIMEFLSQILINQTILNPLGPKDVSLLHEVFEIAPPFFQSHSDLLRFNSILLHFLFDQIRPKLSIALASAAHNTLPKLIAALARFCSFAIDRVACCWTQPGTASLTLTFITDSMNTILDKIEEETKKGTISAKDTALKSEVHGLTKCLNRLVLHMLQDPLREKLQNQSAAQKLDVLGKIIIHKKLILSPTNNEKDFLGSLCKVLHTYLTDSDLEVRSSAIAIWKLLLHSKMDQIEFGFVWKNQKGETIDLKHGFNLLIQPASDLSSQAQANSAFLKWFKDTSLVVNTIFEDVFGKISRNYWSNELKVLEERKAMSKKHLKTRDGRTNKSLEVERISRQRIMEDNSRLQLHILSSEIARYHQSKNEAIDLERYHNRKWAQRRVALFHELHIWGAVPNDPETDSPLHPGLALPPHPLHKWMLDLTEGPNRMRSKTRRNDDFYANYPYDPKNLQASANGPVIYPTATPQSTSAKAFSLLSPSDRILCDRSYYVQRSLRRHQLLAAAQMRSARIGGGGVVVGVGGVSTSASGIGVGSAGGAHGNGEDDEEEDTSSEEMSSLEASQELMRSGSLPLRAGSPAPKLKRRKKKVKKATTKTSTTTTTTTATTVTGDKQTSSASSTPTKRHSEGTIGDDYASETSESSMTDGEEYSYETDEDDDLAGMDPEQAALERLNRLGKLIPAAQRHVASELEEEESPATLTSSGRAAKRSSNPTGTTAAVGNLSKTSSKASVSEKAAAPAGALTSSRNKDVPAPSPQQQAQGANESDDDTANDLSQMEDDTGGKKSLEDTLAAQQFANDMEMEAEEEGDQKLKKLLQPGDEPTDMYNCGRVVGLDKFDGIFVICQSNAYFIHDYHITSNHELVEVLRPKNLSYSAGSGSGSASGNGSDPSRQSIISHDGEDYTRRVIRWSHVDVEQVLRRRYLLRPVAIEIFSVDGRNSLLVFELADRDRVINVMTVKQQAVANRLAQSTGIASVPAKSLKLSLKESTDLWSSGQITNFEYLMRLNTIAGRSYNDLTQYPVFPWIVADYTSSQLDFSNPATFRDLTKPMGALGEERREKLLERYEMLDDSVPRFHYGSHYSSAAIVLYYLIRLEPMTQQFLTLQGGRFDRPDRLFESVHDSWFAASSENPMDVKELVPEFYYLPEAFLNRNNFIFGRKQTGDEAFIDDVILPPWANGDAHTFVRMNRQALESQYVSENLHHWIDLIFGFKQQGPAAEAAMNLFYYLTYEGAVDIDKISDAVERQGIIDQINNFGQTPTQLFKKPHPKRQVLPKLNLSLFGSVGLHQQQQLLGMSPNSGEITPSSSSVSLASPGGSLYAPSSSYPSSSSLTTAPGGNEKEEGMIIHVTSTTGVRDSSAIPGTSSTSSSLSPATATTTSFTANTTTAVTSTATTPAPPSRTVIQCTAMTNKGVSSGLAIGQVVTNASEKVIALEMMKVSLPGHLQRRIAWGYDDMALRFWDGDRVVHVVPNTFHRSGIISCVAISGDGKYVVTGGTDAILCVFRLDWEGKKPLFHLASVGSVSSKLIGHCAPIAHVTVSRAFSLIVSADTMGQVLIWDLNTFQFTRSLVGPLTDPSSPNYRPSFYGYFPQEYGGVSGYLETTSSSSSSSAAHGAYPFGTQHSAFSVATSATSPGTPRSTSKRLHIYHEHQYSVDGDIRASLAEASVEDGMSQKPSSNNIDIVKIDDANGNIYTSSHGTLCIWDLNGELLAQEEVSTTSSVSSFTTTQCPDWMDGVNFLVVGFKDGAIRVYRQDTSPRLENVAMVDGKWPQLPPGRLILHHQFPDKHKAPITALCLSTNQKKLYSGDANGTLLKWEEMKIERGE